MSSTALTPRPGVFSLAPQSFQEALNFCKLMADSGMVPKDYVGQPGRILAAIQYGAEVGLPPMQSLQRIFIVHGRPTMDVRGLLSIVEASGLLVNKIEAWDGETLTATVTLQRKGRPQPIISTFSKADADRVLAKEDGNTIRLSEKALYKSYPQRMYTRRALGYALQDEFADVIGGLVAWDITAEAADASGDGPRGGGAVIDGQVIESKPAPTSGVIDPELALKLEQAFGAIHLPPPQQRMKLAAFRGRETELLDWCRKEWAARNGVKAKPKPEAQVIEEKAVEAQASTPAELPEPEPEPQRDAEAPVLLAKTADGAIVNRATGEVIAEPASKLAPAGRKKRTSADQPTLVE